MDQLPSGVNIRKALTLEKACTSFCLPNGGNQRGGGVKPFHEKGIPLFGWCLGAGPAKQTYGSDLDLTFLKKRQMA